LIQKSKNPIILAGLGAYHSQATEVLIQLAEKSGALLTTSLKGKDMFRNHPLDIGVMGGFSHSLARKYIRQTDCLIVFGASLNFYTTLEGFLLPNASIIHVDTIRSNIGRWYPNDIAIVGDAQEIAKQLLTALDDKPTDLKFFHHKDVLDSIAQFDIAKDFKDDSTENRINPKTVAAELSQIFPPERNVIWDVGLFMLAVPYFATKNPSHFKMSGDSLSIGLGLGVAMGYAAAHPDRLTVCFVGDGGLLMQIGELETIVREQLPMVIVVMNDGDYGAEVFALKAVDLPTETASFPVVDFAPIAQGFGFEAHTIGTREELLKLAPLLKKPSKPILIDCKIYNNPLDCCNFTKEFLKMALQFPKLLPEPLLWH